VDNRTRIKTYFEGFIKKTFKKDELQRFFLNHPYQKKFFNNMCEELIKIEYARLRTFNAQKFKKVVEDMTRMFCNAALEQKEQHLLTDLQKEMLSRKYSEEQEAQKEQDLEIEGIIEAKRDDHQLNTKSE
jgi:hypothetical protein